MADERRYLELSKRLFAELEVKKRELARLQQPIAVVGMACRFPEAPSHRVFWERLLAGYDAVTRGRPDEVIPRPEAATAPPWGAYLAGIDRFDAKFFRIAPVEAHLMDPQQRLLLEVSWEALEDAAMAPRGFMGGRVGVYMGIMTNDYQWFIPPDESSVYGGTGTTFSAAIGRIAFSLGFEGPAIAVDTACSSSLVAMHQAAAGLQRGEADMALAGGVNAILLSEVSEVAARAGMLSPQGRCRTFDAAANGYVRGEGCGVLVLKRLPDAEAAGDRILGVLAGSAVNQDGASAGLTVPNGPAQERVIAEALRRAGVRPSQVDYLEAHGTGTELGDPIEIQAAGSVYSAGRDGSRPLLVGSVKTNIGHLEAAAGVAGVIKVLLAMQKGVIPRHLHFEHPSPRMDWDRLPLRVTSETTPWPFRPDVPARAGVSSFGLSGTNAHAIFEAYGIPPQGSGASVAVVSDFDPAEEGPAGHRELRFLPLSGRTPEALSDLAGRYLAWLGDTKNMSPEDLADLAWTAGVGRSHFSHRAAPVFRDLEGLRERLGQLAESRGGGDGATPGKVAFLYTGQGSQWVGMGRHLHETEPVARRVLDRCERVFVEERGESLLSVMFGDSEPSSRLDATEWTQPALFALQSALTELWSSIGVRPHVVMGHSVGELAAAAAARVFGLEEGIRFAARRGLLMGSLPEGGGMTAVFASPETVISAVAALNPGSNRAGLDLASHNGAHQVVSGALAMLEVLEAGFREKGIRTERLATSHAFHSGLMDPMLDDLQDAAEALGASPPAIPLVSNVSGRVFGDGEIPGGEYWRRQARAPVAFRDGVRSLAELGVDVLVEIGPQPVLGPMAALSWPATESGSGPVVVLGPGRQSHFVEAVAQAYEAGLAISFAGCFAGERRRRVSLPTYPFRRDRFWAPPPKRRLLGPALPLLGVRHALASGEVAFEAEWSVASAKWLQDHRVFGDVVAPAAFFAAQAAAAVSAAGRATGAVVLEDVSIERSLVLPNEGRGEDDLPARTVQTVIGRAEEASSASFEVFSRGAEEEDWLRHVVGRLKPGVPGDGVPPALKEPRELKAGLSEVDLVELHRWMAASGIQYGPMFRGLTGLWGGAGEAFGEVAAPDGLEPVGAAVHPALLDACFQVVAGLGWREGGEVEAPDESPGTVWLPVGWDRLWLDGAVPDRVLCHARSPAIRGEAPAQGQEILRADLVLYREDGVPVGGISGFALKKASRAALLAASQQSKDLFYEVTWREGRSLLDAAVFLPDPEAVARDLGVPADLESHGFDKASLGDLDRDLGRLARSYAVSALAELGWDGQTLDVETLGREMGIAEERLRLLGRLLAIVGEGDAAVEEPEKLAERFTELHSANEIEIGLLRRCGPAIAEVLRDRTDALELLFGGTPSAADLYRDAPGSRLANRLVAEVVSRAVSELPEGRRLRVLEVGAGTGGTTGAVLGALPADRVDYLYTDISAGFFSEAEARFSESGARMEYRALDIERDPGEQGFELHRSDLLLAANVLHATRDLGDSLAHCRRLLAPSGLLVVLEGMEAHAWLDVTFGLLPGWWRFADAYRTEHALVGPGLWRRALSDAGYGEVEILGSAESAEGEEVASSGVIVARGPAEVRPDPGLWVVWPAGGEESADLVRELTEQNQRVVVAAEVEVSDRDSWRSFFAGLPEDAPLSGVVHLGALSGHGVEATGGELAGDVARVGGSALALTQGLQDAGASPSSGLWFVTSGGQVIGEECGGEISGSVLWGFGRTVAFEMPDLGVRLVDLPVDRPAAARELARELLYPDRETQVAYREGRRLLPRLVRSGGRVELPAAGSWRLRPDPGGSLRDLRAEAIASPPPGSEELRVAVEAAGLNFLDVLVGMGLVGVDSPLGGEFCGRVLEVGPEVTGVSPGDRVVGFGPGTFGPEVVTWESLVVSAPAGHPAAALATIPVVFVTVALAFEFAGLSAGDSVLVHAGTGGVGHAAIQWARAAGLRVFGTASEPKQAYLRSLGVEGVFDSRSPAFGEAVLSATGGAGVQMVLNSLTSEGFIEASLSCLAEGGRFVEIAKREIWSEEEMASARPDVGYWILAVDRLLVEDPARLGSVLRKVMERVRSGELQPLPYRRYALSEAGTAMERMREARHVGKLVLTPSALARGGLREDRSYLVTGGLGGIGIQVAGWLAERGAGAIVLNGRRGPDEEASAAISELRSRGAEVRVEICDVTDEEAVGRLVAGVGAEAGLPPLGGVIHSVGVLSDGVVANQDWEAFERVLWPKVLGAWHLHRATLDLDLDLFVLFSSFSGVLGNPGQANHAAANVFLDQLASHRRSLGLSGLAIAWGAWLGRGEAEEQRDRIAGRLAAAGGGWMSPQQGLEALERLVRDDATARAVGVVDWSVLGRASGRVPGFLAEVVSGAGAEVDWTPPGDLVSQLRNTPAAEREGLVAAFLQAEVQEVLRLTSPPPLDEGFFDLGMDSLMAVELRNRLNRALSGVWAVPNTAAFDYPNIGSLARRVAEELGGEVLAPVVERRVSVGPPDERIAVVGMACRFPGGPDPGGFWEELAAGRDAVRRGRPDDLMVPLPGTDSAPWGAYVPDLDRFDAEFFRIAPVEAEMLDPQQRLLLEVSWEALEDAGLDPGRLKGSRSGVYVGIGSNDYQTVASAAKLSLYTSTGTSFAAAIGRVAFTLGFEGPALAVDTACSSSLVALHQGVAGLLRGDADLVLTGGVNAMLLAGAREVLSASGVLSPDGRCKTFDAAADGYVRGEGCGMLVLKRLSDAERDGDRILGVLLGSAVNQDGASAGLTVPNGPAQERVIRAALERAGVPPSTVDYLEAHGTGTELGDPIEIQAAAAVYGEGREAERPLLIGSVKTNIGHLESAAGVAGLIKVLLAMREGVIPKHLHFERPNPRMDWERLPVRVTSEATGWPECPDRPVRAGVSSFGISGTNAHVILEGYGSRGAAAVAVSEFASPVGTEFEDREERLLPLSARSPAALSELAGRYLAWFGEVAWGPEELSDAVWTAGVGRSHFAHRAGLVFREFVELQEQLEALASSGGDGGVDREVAPRPDPGKVAFLYTGQGSQWAGMGRDLYEREPAARAVLDRLEEVFREERGTSLLEVMFGDSTRKLGLTQWTQPALYALQVALTELWSGVGIRPEVVLGHSVGELAAAWTAGVFGLEEGMRFAAQRGALMGSLSAGGGMLAAFASEERVLSALSAVNETADGPGLDLAADNGSHWVVSGPQVLLAALAEWLSVEGIRTERLETSHAFHSGLMDPVLEELGSAAEGLSGTPSLPLVSNLTGRVLGSDEVVDGGYWRRQARSPVRFGAGVRTLQELGVGVVVEVGPRAVLGPLAALTWPEGESAPAVVTSLGREAGFVSGVSGAYEAGLPVSFDGLYAGERRRRVSLPTYPFQRERHWVKSGLRLRAGPFHPLLGVRQALASGEVAFETELTASSPEWLGDHRVFGRVVVPGAYYAAQAIAASGLAPAMVEELRIERPLVLPSEGAGDNPARWVQLVLGKEDGSVARSWEVFSRSSETEGWVRHAAGRIRSAFSSGAATVGGSALDSLKKKLSPIPGSEIHRRMAGGGLQYGPAFRGLVTVWCGESEALGEVVLPDGVEDSDAEIHPALLDASFHVLGGIGDLGGADSAGSAENEGMGWLTVGWDVLWVKRKLPRRLVSHAVALADPGVGAGDAEIRKADVTLYTEEGEEVGRVGGLTLRRASRSALLSTSPGVRDLLYATVWRQDSQGVEASDILADPDAVVRGIEVRSVLEAERLDPERVAALDRDLGRLARSYAVSALAELGWDGQTLDVETLGREMGIAEERLRLLGRLLAIVGEGDAAVEEPEKLAERFTELHSANEIEIGLLRRCGPAIAEVLRDRTDALELLFGGTPSAADLYRDAPGSRLANRLVAEVVSRAVSELPEGRRLRVLEVGAGTGGTTGAVLGALPADRVDYLYTDISAGFFSEAEARFSESGARMEYRALDIERDPGEQGFELHRSDLLLAANVLHATRDLEDSLAHCRRLLAPSGLLVVLEGMEAHAWLDVTFGLLPGWWRFADAYRTEHALVGPGLWRRALSDAGYGEVEILGSAESAEGEEVASSGVIVARGPAEVRPDPGLWVVWPAGGEESADLVRELTEQNQRVVVAAEVEVSDRDSWRSFFAGLPEDAPLSGVVHLGALSGHGVEATGGELAGDVARVGGSALALTQGLQDAGASPSSGLWFVTSGGQVIGEECGGEISGSVLWGFGRTVAFEMPDLGVRLVDLPVDRPAAARELARELLYPDRETQVAYREGRRLVPRLVRSGGRVEMPQGGGWRLRADPGGSLQDLATEMVEAHMLHPGEIRAAVEASGLNFHDVLVGMGLVDVDSPLGGEFCGRVLEVGPEVTGVSPGDRVVGFGPGTFGPEVMTWESLVAPAPPGHPAAALATVPAAFVTAALGFEFAELSAGDSVLVHAGTGGVGHAAIQWARAAGLRVFGTASEPKQAYLRSLGVEGVFDSRSPAFGEAILEATDGAGVQMVLNSLTGEGFIEASLSCLAEGGRFVEIGKRGIWSEEAMASVRPDVGYLVLAVDQLQVEDPARVGSVLRGVMERVGSGALQPLPYRRYPLSEAGMAMERMREARHVGKLVLTPSALAGGGLREDRSYLVTGGLGGIGIQVAGWLAERGAGAIVLNGRRGPDEEASAAISELRSRGAEVRVEICDVTDEEAVGRLVAGVGAEAGLPPLGGVIHSVGVLSDGVVANQDWEAFERVLWPKVLGAWHLHRATLDLDLDLFVLFSSFSGVLGNPGQANHAAANVFLDQLASHRRSLGLSGLAIAWGAWLGRGEAEEQRDRIAGRLAAAGGGWMSPQQGLEALERLVRDDATARAVGVVDWSVLGRASGRVPGFLAEVVSGAGAEVDWTPPGDLVSQLRNTPPPGRETLLLRFLQQELQSLLRLSSPPSPDVGFFDLGMDSLMAVEFRNRINRSFAGEYVAPSTVVFDHPDLRRLVRHLLSQLGDFAESAAAAPRITVRRGSDDIAIVGMACRFPMAADTTEFWRMLQEGADAVTRGRPGSPLPTAVPEDGEVWGAFLPDIDRFDADFFRISPEDAQLMDPQQRLLLETSWHALEDANVPPHSLRGSRVGVYASVGYGASEYVGLIAGSETRFAGVQGVVGNAPNTAVGRIAFILGLEGPAISLDTACSSSLVALHQAILGLQRGDADLALTGAANVTLTARAHQTFAEAGLVSSSGRCRTFDAAADGYVRGEGCGMLVVKRLGDAEASGDRILAIVRGSAINQDGARAGLIVPSGPGQERVLAEALDRAGMAPADVDYLEAHGVGSQLGDPIEIGAVSAVYGPGRTADRPLLLGCLKTNMGHLEMAAGVAAVIKVVLAMRAKYIPAQLHFNEPNPNIEWDRSPLRVTAVPARWPEVRGRPARAGVSAFGLSGTNAHVILEAPEQGAENGAAGFGLERVPLSVPAGFDEPLGESEPAAPRKRRLYALSAQSSAALSAAAERHLRLLEGSAAEWTAEDLSNAAWTANVGRSQLTYRAGLVFSDREELLERLRETRDAIANRPRPGGRKIAFLYSGEGSQWTGMGRGLYETEPVARAVLDRCESVFREERSQSLLAVMFGIVGDLDAPEWSQPALYALSVALGALWSSAGVRPDIVFGQGVGELSAAHASGAFNAEEGLRFAARRSELMGSARAATAPDPWEDALPGKWATAPSVPLLSGVTGRLVGPGELRDAAYWRRQARESLGLEAAAPLLVALEADILVEIGPASGLAATIGRIPGDPHSRPTVMVSSQRRTAPQEPAHADGGLLDAVAALYGAGLDISFPALFAGERRRRVSLPTYPFQRKPYWVVPRRRRRTRVRHPLLGERRRSGAGEVTFDAEFSPTEPRWMKDYQLSARSAAPPALFAAQAVCAAMFEAPAGVGVVVDKLKIQRAMSFPDRERDANAFGRTVQAVLKNPRVSSSAREFQLFSCGPSDDDWTPHAVARTGVLLKPPGTRRRGDRRRRARERGPLDVSRFYRRLAAMGIDYGWSFQSLSEIRCGEREAVADVSLPAALDADGVEAHPVLLDGCLQLVAAACGEQLTPFHMCGWDRLWLLRRLPARVVCHAVLLEPGRATNVEAATLLRANLSVFAKTGEQLGQIRGVRFETDPPTARPDP